MTDEEMENSLPIHIRVELDDLKKACKKSPNGWDGFYASIVNTSVDWADKDGSITPEQAYYVRTRYLRCKEEVAAIMRQIRIDWDNGLREVWMGDIAKIPPRYKVHRVSSTWIWYSITPPWYDKTKPNAFLQISNIPGDVYVWKSGEREIPCIRFHLAGEGKIKHRFLAPEMRKPEEKDKWRW